MSDTDTDTELYAPIYVFHYLETPEGRQHIGLAEYADEKAATEAIFDLPEGYKATHIKDLADVNKLDPATVVDFYNAIREPGEDPVQRFHYLRDGRERLYTALATATKTPAPNRDQGAAPIKPVQPEPVQEETAKPPRRKRAAKTEATEPVTESSEADQPTETEEMQTHSETASTKRPAAKNGGAKRKAAAPKKKAAGKKKAGKKTAAVPKKAAAAKKAASPRKATNGTKGPRSGSITEEVIRLMSRANGASKKEMLKRLGELFPKRDEQGMDNTVRGLVSTIGVQYGKKLHKEKDRNRGGTVYTLST